MNGIVVKRPFRLNSINSRTYTPGISLDERTDTYLNFDEVYENIPIQTRALGLTIPIITENGVIEYWFQSGIENRDLVVKHDPDIPRIDTTLVNLQNQINQLSNIEFHVVQELPPVGNPNWIYMLPIEDPSGQNNYNEYVWLMDEQKYEKFGGIDNQYITINNYYTFDSNVFDVNQDNEITNVSLINKHIKFYNNAIDYISSDNKSYFFITEGHVGNRDKVIIFANHTINNNDGYGINIEDDFIQLHKGISNILNEATYKSDSILLRLNNTNENPTEYSHDIFDIDKDNFYATLNSGIFLRVINNNQSSSLGDIIISNNSTGTLQLYKNNDNIQSEFCIANNAANSNISLHRYTLIGSAGDEELIQLDNDGILLKTKRDDALDDNKYIALSTTDHCIKVVKSKLQIGKSNGSAIVYQDIPECIYPLLYDLNYSNRISIADGGYWAGNIGQTDFRNVQRFTSIFTDSSFISDSYVEFANIQAPLRTVFNINVNGKDNLNNPIKNQVNIAPDGIAYSIQDSNSIFGIIKFTATGIEYTQGSTTLSKTWQQLLT